MECTMPLEPKAQVYVDRMVAQAAAVDPPRPPLNQIPLGVFRETLNRLLESLDVPAEPVA